MVLVYILYKAAGFGGGTGFNMDEDKRDDLFNMPENTLGDRSVADSVAEPQMPKEPSLNELQRMVGMIVSPGQTLADIKERPRFFWMMLLLTAFATLVTVITLPELIEYTRTMLNSQFVGDLTPEMIDSAVNMTSTGAIVVVILGMPLACLIMAVVLAVYNLLAGGMASFKQLFALAVYTHMPNIFAQIISIVTIKTMGYEGSLQVNTSPALLLGAENEGFWFLFLSQFGLFSIWSFVLLVMGGAFMMKKNAFWLGFVLIILWCALSAVMAAMGNLSAMA